MLGLPWRYRLRLLLDFRLCSDLPCLAVPGFVMLRLRAVTTRWCFASSGRSSGVPIDLLALEEGLVWRLL